MQYFGFDRPSFGIKMFGFGDNFDPLDLFAGGKQGVWYDPSDKSTLFQDVAGTVPVTTDGDPIGKVLDKSGNNNHATQTVSAARPVYKDNPARLSLDKVDDAIVINMPKRIIGSMTLATTTGTATYGVDIPAGNLTLDGKYLSSTNIVGLVINEGALSAEDESNLVGIFVGKGAVESFVSKNDFYAAWHSNNLTSFPLIDTSSGTNFSTAWYNNKLTSFPLIDTSTGTNFSISWQNNNLTSFPLLNTGSGTNFYAAWFNNNLTSFPLIDTSSGINFQTAWRNNKLTSFPSLNTGNVVNFQAAWHSNNLTSFPLLNTGKGNNFSFAWMENSSLLNFPKNMFDNIKGGDFTNAFINTNLNQESIDGILTSLVTSGISTGTRVFNQSGGSAPSATGQAAIDTLRSRGWTVTVTGGY